MNCYSCAHSDTCFMRIELVRTIRSFKYLASDSVEAKNTGAISSVNALWTALAEACTKYEDKSAKNVADATWSAPHGHTGLAAIGDNEGPICYYTDNPPRSTLMLNTYASIIDGVEQSVNKLKADPISHFHYTDFPSEGQCSSCSNYTKVCGNPPLCSICGAKS